MNKRIILILLVTIAIAALGYFGYRMYTKKSIIEKMENLGFKLSLLERMSYGELTTLNEYIDFSQSYGKEAVPEPDLYRRVQVLSMKYNLFT